MTHHVVFSKKAERQLEAMNARIAEASGRARADAFTGRIVDHCISLALFPQRGTQRDDLRPGIRILGYRRKISIALAVKRDQVVILGIFYGGQDFETILRRSRGR